MSVPISGSAPAGTARLDGQGVWAVFDQWRSNVPFVLALITLIALLVGWLGGEVFEVLPGWAVTIAALIAYVAGGYTGTQGIIEKAREFTLDIDFLMVAAALGAAAIGEWEEGALLLFLFTLSGGLEEFAMDRTRRAIEALGELRPDVAQVRRPEGDVSLPVEEIQLGDIVIVRPGERLPVDGVVSGGASTVDQSPITGESVPVSKAPGDPVFAGTINGGGALEVEMTRSAEESTINKIIRLVAEAREDAAPTQRFIDRFSQPYTYAVLAATLLAIVIPQLFSGEAFADTIYRAMTLLVVASPCALIISTPASVLSAIAASARSGVLFKGGAYLEKVGDISIVAFDKTGTLTYGKPQVTNIHPLTGYSKKELLQVAASAELLSEHHIGQAIVAQARAEGLELETPTNFQGIAGHGLQAEFARNGRTETVYIGNHRLFMSEDMDISPAIRAIGEALQRQGKTVVLVVRRSTVEDTLGETRDWDVMGYLAVADALREQAKDVVDDLHAIGVKRVVMLTGDNQSVADAIGDEAGIDEVYGGLLPEEKVEKIQQLVKEGQVAMVGDGVNDAPALATASVGVAMGAGGTDVALETADVILMSSDLSKLPYTVRLGRRATQIVRQNVVFSIGVIVTLVALTVLAPLVMPGFVLPLPLGVVGHEGSTLIVVLNGLRMLGMRSGPVTR